MPKKEYIISEAWCPELQSEKTIIQLYEKSYGTPEFKYIFHPPKLEKFNGQAVLYGKIPPNIHLFLSIENIADHEAFQRFENLISLKRFRIKETCLKDFVTKPLEVIKHLKNYTSPY